MTSNTSSNPKPQRKKPSRRRFFWKLLTLIARQFKGWDWTLLTICVIIATLIWTFNALNKSNYVTLINFPLHIKHERQDVVALEPPPNSIPIEISGTGWQLLQKVLKLGNSSININISDPTKISHITAKALLPELNILLKDIKIRQIQKDTIFFKYDTLEEKHVWVLLDTQKLKLAQDYKLQSQPQVSPPKIKLKGAASILKTLSDTLWVEWEEENIDENIKDFVSLPALPAFVESGIKQVEIDLKVDKHFLQSHTLPLEVENFPYLNKEGKNTSSLVLQDSLILLTYWLSYEQQGLQIPDSLIKPFVDWQTLNRKDSTLKVQLKLPPYCKYAKLSPAYVRIRKRQ
ncbi:hypothetical protein [Hugenholtzia roseola]|uniref:hypothetical protein n=1 Tax=Hugenholtzia roseola TaxID=1002 RepID=UPI0012B61742|nr:hypothetical protein [Hugenholtzia roseola]